MIHPKSQIGAATRDGIFRAAAVVMAFLALTGTRAFAHGDVSVEIQKVTALIVSAPDDARLRLRRAELHSTHRDWAAAEADYAEAARLDPGLATVDLARGEMLRQSGDFEGAIKVLDRFVSREPRNAAGRVARGRSLAAGGWALPAAKDFAAAIGLSGETDPGLYFDHAHALAAAGRPEDAVKSLDAGIARMGPLVTLVVPAIDFEVRLGRYDAALKRIDRFAAGQPRKERWLARRGEVLEKAGRTAEARRAYADAQAAIAVLPEERRGVAAMAELQRQLDAGIARLGVAANPEGAR